MAEAVLYEKKGRIAYITINRPERMNAVNVDVRKGLAAAFIELRDDAEVWIGILTGAGDKAFCAGGDLKENLARAQGEIVTDEPKTPEGQLRVSYGTFMHEIDLWKPVIAAVNGYALGGGFALALACDIRLCSENAQFGASEVRWSHMAGGQAYVLPRSVPLGWAYWFCLTGQSIDAQTAYRIGIVQGVYPQSQLMEEATKLAEIINANGPLVAQHTKEFIQRSLDMPLSVARQMESVYYHRLRQSPDYDEGSAAFTEKRRPSYTGRTRAGQASD